MKLGSDPSRSENANYDAHGWANASGSQDGGSGRSFAAHLRLCGFSSASTSKRKVFTVVSRTLNASLITIFANRSLLATLLSLKIYVTVVALTPLFIKYVKGFFMNKTDFNPESHDRQNGQSVIMSCSKMRCSKTWGSCTILKILIALMSVMMFGCSFSSMTQSHIEKSYRALLAKQFKSDAKYYQITKFKKELVLEKTDKLYVVLVSYMLKINPAKKYVSTTNKMILESVIPGFTRNLLVFKKVRAKWEIVDPHWKHKDHKTFKKPEHYVKLIIHSGYWQVKYFKDKYKNYAAYTILNPDPKIVAHAQRAREIYQRVQQGEAPPPCTNVSQTGQTRIFRYKKQLPVILPKASSIRLLVNSKHLLYGFDIVQPRKQATGTPGFIHPVTIDASSPGTYNAYYYRLCGKDVEYGALPIKIIPVAEFERHIEKKQKANR